MPGGNMMPTDELWMVFLKYINEKKKANEQLWENINNWILVHGIWIPTVLYS